MPHPDHSEATPRAPVTLDEHKATLAPHRLRLATLVFLRRGGEVLLAMKRRGFGQGKWNGPGGKVRAGESVEHAATREAREEVGAEVLSLRHAATLDFYFVGIPEGQDWDQRVRALTGEACFSE